MPPIVACADVETSTGYQRPSGFKRRVQLVEHDAGLDPGGAALGVDLEHAVQVLAGVDDERGADRLAALRRAGAARQDRHAGVRRRPRRAQTASSARARHDDAERLDLVDRRIGRVAAAAPGVEQHFARELAAEACLEGVERRSGHAAGVYSRAEGGYCRAAAAVAGAHRQGGRLIADADLATARVSACSLLKFDIW